MTTATMTAPRRVLATRQARWAQSLARLLASAGVQPNAVSIAGVGFALLAGAAFYVSSLRGDAPRIALLLAAAAGIQLRLLCNLLDGMLAVEEGLKSPTGDIFNEIPDRIADVVILVGAGHAATSIGPGGSLGWMAAVAAVFTAYVRVFAGSLGFAQPFIGPMAKQHRMFTLTVATLAAAIEAAIGLPPRAAAVGLILIIAGSLITAVRRVRLVVSEAGAR